MILGLPCPFEAPADPTMEGPVGSNLILTPDPFALMWDAHIGGTPPSGTILQLRTTPPHSPGIVSRIDRTRLVSSATEEGVFDITDAYLSQFGIGIRCPQTLGGWTRMVNCATVTESPWVQANIDNPCTIPICPGGDCEISGPAEVMNDDTVTFSTAACCPGEPQTDYAQAITADRGTITGSEGGINCGNLGLFLYTAPTDTGPDTIHGLFTFANGETCSTTATVEVTGGGGGGG